MYHKINKQETAIYSNTIIDNAPTMMGRATHIHTETNIYLP